VGEADFVLLQVRLGLGGIELDVHASKYASHMHRAQVARFA
jgi:hypothetical protein